MKKWGKSGRNGRRKRKPGKERRHRKGIWSAQGAEECLFYGRGSLGSFMAAGIFRPVDIHVMLENGAVSIIIGLGV